jgi:hypothetical protein
MSIACDRAVAERLKLLLLLDRLVFGESRPDSPLGLKVDRSSHRWIIALEGADFHHL